MRRALALPALLLAFATAAGCAPSTSSGNTSASDDKSGTLRVWLFQEVANDPKEKVVAEAVKEFEKAHPGAKAQVTYIPIDTRAEKMKAAFNGPKSAPDVVEFGNTDTAGYVADGGLADITADFGSGPRRRTSPTRSSPRSAWTGKCTGCPGSWVCGRCTTAPTPSRSWA